MKMAEPKPESQRKSAGRTGNPAASRQEVRSVVVGVALLEALAQVTGPLPLADIARRAGMPAAKAHRYLAGYMNAGLVTQDRATGRYDLGPFALHLGLAAIRRLDVVAAAEPVMEALRDEIDETVSLAVWTSRGPTLVRWVTGTAAMTINISPGTVLPITTSSNGQLFAAHLPESATRALVDQELALAAAQPSAAGKPRSRAELEPILACARRDAMTRVSGVVLRGISSLSVPIIGHAGTILATLTVVGLESVLDSSPAGAPARALWQAGADLSRRMGAEPSATPREGSRPQPRSDRRGRDKDGGMP